MNDEAGMQVEKMLEPLIRQHGLRKVQADLARLLPRAKWQEWQRVANIAANVDRRIRREQKSATT